AQYRGRIDHRSRMDADPPGPRQSDFRGYIHADLFHPRANTAGCIYEPSEFRPTQSLLPDISGAMMAATGHFYRQPEIPTLRPHAPGRTGSATRHHRVP